MIDFWHQFLFLVSFLAHSFKFRQKIADMTEQQLSYLFLAVAAVHCWSDFSLSWGTEIGCPGSTGGAFVKKTAMNSVGQFRKKMVRSSLSYMGKSSSKVQTKVSTVTWQNNFFAIFALIFVEI